MKRTTESITKGDEVVQVVFKPYKRPTVSRRKIKGDCQVLAISAALDLPYDEVRNVLYANGWRDGGTNVRWSWEVGMRNTLAHFGYFPMKKKWHWTADQKTRRLLNLYETAARFPKGRNIAICYRHVACIKNGVVIDHQHNKPETFKVQYVWALKKFPRVKSLAQELPK